MPEKVDLKLDWASYKAARYACEHWHYSKCVPVGKLVKIGVWENNKFIGVVIFGRGANKDLLKPYGLDQTQGAELVRIALTSHKSTVTRIIKIALKMLKGICPEIKLIISFADPEQGHEGKIYQAGNWIYCGKSNAADEYLYKGKRWHGRAFRKSFGSHKNYDVEIVKGSSKHRYLMFLDKRVKQAMTGTTSTAAEQHRPTRSKQVKNDSRQTQSAA
jgi:hypothetical protein